MRKTLELYFIKQTYFCKFLYKDGFIEKVSIFGKA